jgi:hypothetical protein
LWYYLSVTVSRFEQEVRRNQHEPAPAANNITRGYDGASLQVRLRGGFTTRLSLRNPQDGRAIEVLHADDDLKVGKLKATSHTMSPVGPSTGIGEQHGFPRWSDYHVFAGHVQDGVAISGFQAMTYDHNMGLGKVFGLSRSRLVSDSTLFNFAADTIQTSLGEHYYFALDSEEAIAGIRVSGVSLEDLFGEGATDAITHNGVSKYWRWFKRDATIHFPAGHSVRLGASVIRDGEPTKDPVGMLVWHRGDSPSICFEPVVGVSSKPDDLYDNTGLTIPGYGSVTLRTSIELA